MGHPIFLVLQGITFLITVITIGVGKSGSNVHLSCPKQFQEMINELKEIIVEEHHPALDELATCVLQNIGKIKPPKHSKKGPDVTQNTVCGIAINKAIMKCIGNKNSRKEDESSIVNHFNKAFEAINKFLTNFLKNGFPLDPLDGDTEKGVDNFGMGGKPHKNCENFCEKNKHWCQSSPRRPQKPPPGSVLRKCRECNKCERVTTDACDPNDPNVNLDCGFGGMVPKGTWIETHPHCKEVEPSTECCTSVKCEAANTTVIEDICKAKTPEGDPCTLANCIPSPEESCYRFYFDSEEEKCIKLSHQCFYGTRNKFNTLEECENKCLQEEPEVEPESEEKTTEPSSEETTTPNSIPEICKLKVSVLYLPGCTSKKPGNARRGFDFYFDSESGKCMRIRKGCLVETENKFDTKEECEQTCQLPDEKFCLLKPEVGTCKGAIERWYFDLAFDGCRNFTYGGCGGNANNFKTKKECDKKSISCLDYQETSEETTDKPDSEPCYSIVGHMINPPVPCKFPFTYQGKEYHKCTKKDHDKDKPWCALNMDHPYFNISSDEGNKCTLCWKNETYKWGDCLMSSGCEIEEPDENFCNLKPEPGNCFGDMPRWYFDPVFGGCRKFSYGGCGGNANRFQTKEECDKKSLSCLDEPSTTIPNISEEPETLKPDPESCEGVTKPCQFPGCSTLSCEDFCEKDPHCGKIHGNPNYKLDHKCCGCNLCKDVEVVTKPGGAGDPCENPDCEKLGMVPKGSVDHPPCKEVEPTTECCTSVFCPIDD